MDEGEKLEKVDRLALDQWRRKWFVSLVHVAEILPELSFGERYREPAKVDVSPRFGFCTTRSGGR